MEKGSKWKKNQVEPVPHEEAQRKKKITWAEI